MTPDQIILLIIGAVCGTGAGMLIVLAIWDVLATGRLRQPFPGRRKHDWRRKTRLGR